MQGDTSPSKVRFEAIKAKWESVSTSPAKQENQPLPKREGPRTFTSKTVSQSTSDSHHTTTTTHPIFSADAMKPASEPIRHPVMYKSLTTSNLPVLVRSRPVSGASFSSKSRIPTPHNDPRRVKLTASFLTPRYEVQKSSSLRGGKRRVETINGEVVSVATVREITSPQEFQRWSGRFSSIEDRLRTEAMESDHRKKHSLSDISHMFSDEHRHRHHDDHRVQRVFSELKELCVTDEATLSLRKYMIKFADVNKMPWLRNQLPPAPPKSTPTLRESDRESSTSSRKSTTFLKELFGVARRKTSTHSARS